MSAYRAKLTGIYISILLIKVLCKVKSITIGTVAFGCGGLSALQHAFAR